MICENVFLSATQPDPMYLRLLNVLLADVGPGSSVGIATELRAGRLGIESRWGRDISPVQTGPGAHPASCKMGTESFLRVKCGRGVLLTTHPLLVLRYVRVELYLYPPSGPHRACNGITLPLLLADTVIMYKFMNSPIIKHAFQ